MNGNARCGDKKEEQSQKKPAIIDAEEKIPKLLSA